MTIFSVPRPFTGPYDAIQRNAIGSWLEMDVEVMLLHEPGSNARDVARELQLRSFEIAVTAEGTPLLDSIFQTAFAHIDTPLSCYINADIIVLGPLHRAAAVCAERFDHFLMIGQRTDVDLQAARLDYDGDWRTPLRQVAREHGQLYPACGMDYFATPGNIWGEIAPFALGRAAWDNWLVARALRTGVPVVDATTDVTIVHQAHPMMPNCRQRPESVANYALLDDLGDGNAGCAQAPWMMERGQIRKRTGG